jgi:hypothetical protein
VRSLNREKCSFGHDEGADPDRPDADVGFEVGQEGGGIGDRDIDILDDRLGARAKVLKPFSGQRWLARMIFW